MKNLDKTLWIKRIFMVLMDICIVILTSITALIVRFEFSLSAVPKYYIGVVWSSLPATLVIAIIVFYVFRLYSSLWVYAGVTELYYRLRLGILSKKWNRLRHHPAGRSERIPETG